MGITDTQDDDVAANLRTWPLQLGDHAAGSLVGDAVSGTLEPSHMLNKSVTKAVRLLRELAGHSRAGATVTTLAKSSGIARPTAFRLLTSLEQAGLVDRADSRYILGWELVRLARHADPHAGLVARALPTLQELADDLNESVILSMPNVTDGLDLVVKVGGSHVIGDSHDVNQKLPLHASSSGKVLLAEMGDDRVKSLLPQRLEAFTAHTITDRSALLSELKSVRKQGFGIIDNELEEGLISLSQPVRDSSGTLVAILTVNGPRYRFGHSRVPEALQRMQRSVARLADSFWPDPDATDHDPSSVRSHDR